MDAVKLNSVADLRNCSQGTYLVPYGNYEFIVFKGNTDENASLNLDGYGIGSVKDGKMVTSYLNPNSNSIDVIMRTKGGGNAYETSRWQEAAAGFFSDVKSNLNLKQENTMLMGFSLSAERTVPYAANYAANTGSSHFSTIVVESSCTPPTVLSEAQRRSLIDHDVTVFNVYQAKKQQRSLISPLHLQNYEGVHIVDVEINVKNSNGDLHVLPYDVLLASGINNLANGSFDFNNLPKTFTVNRQSSPYYGKTFDLDYKFVEHYLDENGNYVSRELNASEVNKVSGKANIPGYDFDGIQTDNFTITKKESAAKQKYYGLQYLDKLSLHSTKPISSEYSYVESFVSQLRDQIKSTNFLENYSYFNFRSADGILSIIGEYIEKYYQIVGELMEDLASESESVLSYAQAMIDMDNDLSGQVGTINEGEPALSMSPPATQAPVTTPTNTTMPTTTPVNTQAPVYQPSYTGGGSGGSGGRSKKEPTIQSTLEEVGGLGGELQYSILEEAPRVTPTPTATEPEQVVVTQEPSTPPTVQPPVNEPAYTEPYSYQAPVYEATPQSSIPSQNITNTLVHTTPVETSDLFEYASPVSVKNPYVSSMEFTGSSDITVPLPTEIYPNAPISTIAPVASNPNNPKSSYLKPLIGIGLVGATVGGGIYALKKVKEKEKRDLQGEEEFTFEEDPILD